MKIELGTSGKKKVFINGDVMLTTRLLVTADSGGGKTVLLKRLCEQMAEKIPVIIIDPEGEFAPLREKFNFILVGPGGEIPAHPRSATLVAQTILKLRTSAIVDLYEMDESVRHEFVRNFCQGLINAPKTLWHPTVVIVDEAHMFCPESGKGESIASDWVKALSTRGRKRGLCPIYATQRLSEFSKGASSMCLNRLVGGTFEDVNVARAIDTLSIPSAEKGDFKKEIKLLEPGFFYGLGRAISKERILIHIGPIVTPHGKEAQKYAVVPPPPLEEIAKLIPKLAELPKTAEEKAQTEKELRAEIKALKLSLKQAQYEQTKSPVGVAPDKHLVKHQVKQTDISKDIARATAPLIRALEDVMKIIVRVETFGTLAHLKDEELDRLLATVKQQVKKLAEEKLTARDKEISSLQRDMKAAGARIEKLLEEQGKKVVIDVKAGSSPNIPAVDQKRTAAVPPERGAIVAHRPPGSGNGHGDLTPYQVDMLRGLIELEAMGRMEPPWSLAGAASGKSASSSTFEKYAANLKAKGLIEYPTSGRMRLTDAGRAAAPAVVDFPSLEEIQERTLKLLTPYQADLLRVLIQAGTEPLSWDDLASQSGKQATSSTFEKYMASLRSMEFIEYTGPKRAKAASWLVE